MTNQQLITLLKEKVASEKHLTLEVIRLLREVDRRQCYLERGFSSLFDFCTRELGYEETAAYRRINAARLMTQIPAVEAKVASGKLTLSSLNQASQFFRKEKKAKKVYNIDDKRKVLEQLENKSYRETAKTLADLAPEHATQERHRELGNDLIEIKIIVDREFNEEIKDLKSKMSHTNPSMTHGELYKLLVRQKTKAIKPKTAAPPKITKTIPVAIKREVYKRDQGKCTYPGCNSKHLLQYDHIKPQAYGGKHTADNLRLLCFAHHKLITEKIFGKPMPKTEDDTFKP